MFSYGFRVISGYVVYSDICFCCCIYINIVEVSVVKCDMFNVIEFQSFNGFFINVVIYKYNNIVEFIVICSG